MNSEKRAFLWRALEQPGLEHLLLTFDESSIAADGIVIGLNEEKPFRLQYHIEMDKAWRVLICSTKVWCPDLHQLVLKSDAKGNWKDKNGINMAELSGSIDVDITVTPFTNTLPVRRLQLQEGESAEIHVAYIDVPDLNLSKNRQRYTCIEQKPNSALYRFEGLDTGFEADLTVDELGLVIDYPNLWSRIF